METLQSGKGVLVNFPTEEVFVSPTAKSANGVVYSSKPLSYHDVLIENFSITFKDGKAISSTAEKGAEILNEMIHSCENADYLGEVALVEYDSAINNLNIKPGSGLSWGWLQGSVSQLDREHHGPRIGCTPGSDLRIINSL